jgi:murein DD-endopeptidase MepM/ murein hydrolase activator NlpD
MSLTNHFMKRALNFLTSIFILASCSTAKTPIPPTSTIALQETPPQISTAASSTSTSIPIPSVQTATAKIIQCDPQVDDFCIIEGHFVLQRPIKPPANDIVDSTYPYGSTAKEKRDPHHGVEFLNKFGTPVYAAADGVVVFAGPDNVAIYSPWTNFYGNVIVIRHDDDLFTLYAHLSKIEVEAGQNIRAGDKIGEVGQSGVATGSHLHFEVRRGDVEDYFSTANPELWLVPNKVENGTVAISVVDENDQFLFTELTVNYYLDRSQPAVLSYYVTTYSRDLATGEENAALSDLAPGSYRIAFTMNGRVYERWVEVKSGRLTQVVFVVK